MGKSFLPPANYPILNPQTGLINTEWYLALRNILIFQGQGILVSTSGQGNAVVREIEGGTGITVTNGDGQAGNPTITSNFDGFGFSCSNVFTNKELLGIGIFPVAITFPSATINADVKALVPPAANASFSIVPNVGGVDQAAVGTINFLAGATSGSVTWTPNPYTMPANTVFKIYAPTPRDTSLSFVTAFIPGDL